MGSVSMPTVAAADRSETEAFLRQCFDNRYAVADQAIKELQGAILSYRQFVSSVVADDPRLEPMDSLLDSKVALVHERMRHAVLRWNTDIRNVLLRYSHHSEMIIVQCEEELGKRFGH